MTDHLASLGAIAMTQADYLDLLEQAEGSPMLSLPDALADVTKSGGHSSPGNAIAQSLTQTS